MINVSEHTIAVDTLHIAEFFGGKLDIYDNTYACNLFLLHPGGELQTFFPPFCTHTCTICSAE